jgi:hypothetical protein
VMRLGILGPAKGDLPALARAVTRLFDDAQVDRVLYLGNDGALDKIALVWAHRLVGPNPSQDALLARAALRCATGSPEAIDSFVRAERQRTRLRLLTSLPDGNRRTIEFLDGRVALFVYDKGVLDEEDITAASMLVFGRSQEPMMKRIGSRMFISPGPLGSAGGGTGVLEEGESAGVRVEIRNASGQVTAEDVLGGGPLMPGIKMRVQSGKTGG